MEKKENDQHPRPPVKQPGQAWMVTFCLHHAVAPGALSHYTDQLDKLSWKINNRKKRQLYDQQLKELEKEYQRTRRHYFNAYDRLMAKNTDHSIDLTRADLSQIIIEGITPGASTPIENYAWCILPNHVHWVFRIRERDHNGNPVSLSDITETVKSNTARKILQLLGTEGPLWQKENFEAPLANPRKLANAIEFTLKQPGNRSPVS